MTQPNWQISPEQQDKLRELADACTSAADEAIAVLREAARRRAAGWGRAQRTSTDSQHQDER